MKKHIIKLFSNFNPILILRMKELTGAISAIYYDCLLEDYSVISIAVLYKGTVLLKDLNEGTPLTRQLPSSDEYGISQFVHVYSSREDWAKNKAEVMNTKAFNSYTDTRINGLLQMVNNLDCGMTIKDAHFINDFYSILLLKASSKKTGMEYVVMAMCGECTVYYYDDCDEEDLDAYINLIQRINELIGGVPLWQKQRKLQTNCLSITGMQTYSS